MFAQMSSTSSSRVQGTERAVTPGVTAEVQEQNPVCHKAHPAAAQHGVLAARGSRSTKIVGIVGLSLVPRSITWSQGNQEHSGTHCCPGASPAAAPKHKNHT